MKTEDYPLGSKAHIAALEKLLESSTDAMEELISFVPGPDVAKKDTDILYDTKDIQDKIGALVVSLSLAGYSSYVPKTEEEYIDEYIGMAEDMEKRMNDTRVYLELRAKDDPVTGVESTFFTLRKNDTSYPLDTHTARYLEGSYLIRTYIVSTYVLRDVLFGEIQSGRTWVDLKTNQSIGDVEINNILVAHPCAAGPTYIHTQSVRVSSLNLLLKRLTDRED